MKIFSNQVAFWNQRKDQRTMKKTLYTFIGLAAIATLISACSAGGDNPGIEYAPNMYHSFAYEPMTQLAEEPNTINPHGMNMRLPVKGTIARGQMDYATYQMDKTNESYEAATSLKIRCLQPNITWPKENAFTILTVHLATLKTEMVKERL